MTPDSVTIRETDGTKITLALDKDTKRTGTLAPERCHSQLPQREGEARCQQHQGKRNDREARHGRHNSKETYTT